MKKSVRAIALLLAVLSILPLSSCFDPNYDWDLPEREPVIFPPILDPPDVTKEVETIPPEITETPEEGLIFRLSVDGTHYIAVGCSDKNIETITIPDKYNDLYVTEIADYAFAGMEKLREIEIPDSVERVGVGAFNGCDMLEFFVSQGGKYLGNGKNEFSVLIGRADDTALSIVPSTRVIADGAFYEDELLMLLIVPSSVLYIGDGAFAGCKNLKSLTFEAGYCTIGDNAFRECTSLISAIGMYLGNWATYVSNIGDYAFYGCTSLQQTTITSRARRIGKWAFGDCERLSAIELGLNLSVIEERSFSGCRGLSSVKIDQGVSEIEPYAFYGCSKLGDISLPTGIENIAPTAFSGCSLNYLVYEGCGYLGNIDNRHEYLMEVIGTETVMRIHPKTRRLRQGVIASNPQLESIQMLGTGAYLHVAGDCLIDTEQKKVIAGLSTAVIPADGSVSAIGDYAFAEMEEMEITAIPDSVTEIGDYAFFGCKWVREMSFGDDLESIGDYAFSKTMLSELKIPHSVTHIGKYAFSDCNILWNVQIGQNVTSIEEGVFSNCPLIVTVAHSGELVSIGDYAFKYCALGQFDFNEGLQYIGVSAFENCGSLTEAALPDSLVEIDDYAFGHCTRLGLITLGRGLCRIGDNAFMSVYANVHYLGTLAEWESIEVGTNTLNYPLIVFCKDGTALIPAESREE